jgi:hypothetical protein
MHATGELAPLLLVELADVSPLAGEATAFVL